MASSFRSIACVIVALSVSACGERTLKETAADLALAQRLALPPEESRVDRDLWNSVRVAYRRNGGAMLWLDESGPRPQAAALAATLANAASDGLDPMQYEVPPFESIARDDGGLFEVERYLPASAADADVRMTTAAVRYMRDLRGRVAPGGGVAATWFGTKHRVSVGKLVQRAAHARDVESALRRTAPRHPQYERQRGALARLRLLASHGGWPSVPASAVVRASAKNPDLAPFRARLAASAHYVAPADPSLERDALTLGVRRFQLEHGLADDGVPGKATVDAMNVPIEHRIRQIEVNLERMRWLPDDLGDTHVLVNVPTFHLEAIEDGERALAMRVITGKRGTPTPIFSDTMETLVFSPYWNVPPSIQRGEVLPKLREDPEYLARENMELLVDGASVDPWFADLSDPSIRIRQRPGAGNALGHVKFLFPNPHNVYLHDTPADALFAKPARGFSHGCIRVEKPDELARWVLRDDARWTDQTIEQAMHSGRERHVALAESIPVHVVYFTTWVGDDGAVRFHHDLYGHDARHAAAIPSGAGVASATIAAR